MVYHVNPSRYGDNPINMNTGDARGDMYFSLKTAYLPVQCQESSGGGGGGGGAGFSGFNCNNAETTGPDLVVTKLKLEVDNRFGQYQMCNVCLDGKDPLGFVRRRRRRLFGGGGGNHSWPGGGGNHSGWPGGGNRTQRSCRWLLSSRVE